MPRQYEEIKKQITILHCDCVAETVFFFSIIFADCNKYELCVLGIQGGGARPRRISSDNRDRSILITQ